MKINSDNKADTSIITCSTATVNYPASNMQDTRLSKIFKAASPVNIDITGAGGQTEYYDAYTNELTDSTDLTTASWTKINGATAVASSETIDGLPFTKLGSTTSTTDPNVKQNLVLGSTARKSATVILRNVNTTGEVTQFYVLQALSTAQIKGLVEINWDTKAVTLLTGIKLKADWLDDITVKINFISLNGEGGALTAWQYRIDPRQTNGDSSQFILATACQLVDYIDDPLVATNLISRYFLDGNSNDSYGTNHGTDTDVTYVTGKNNQAASFNGTTSKISLGDFGSFENGFSIFAFFKLNTGALSSLNIIFTKNLEIILRVNTDGMVYGYTYDGVDYEPRVRSTTVISENVWYSTALTYDGTTLKLYVNAVLEDSELRPTWTNTVNAAFIGSILTDGLIDEVSIFSAATSQTDITALHNRVSNIVLPPMYPYYNGTHAADVVDKTFAMPSKFTIDMMIDPKFLYDTAVAACEILNWYIDSTHLFRVTYVASQDKYQVYWNDGGTTANLASQQFDDGTTYTNINQRLRIIISPDLTTGTTAGSRLIIIPQESGAVFEDTTWSATPSIKSTAFPTLSIGDLVGAYQANSNIEYIRIYSGTLVGAVTSNADADTLLADKYTLADYTFMTRIKADSLVLANTTLRDGDTITLRANDLDSFNAGAPVDETITWSTGIIRHTFTTASYRYWRLAVTSVNDVEIGRLFLGETYSPPAISPAFSFSRDSKSIKTISVSGQSYQDQRYFNSVLSVKFPKLTHAQKATMIAWFEDIDIGKPFFLTFDESQLDITTIYVTIDGDSLNFNLLENPNYYETALSFIEEVK